MLLINDLLQCAYLVHLQKAFGTVSHVQLLETLKNAGFRGTILQLTNHLHNRKQSVKNIQ